MSITIVNVLSTGEMAQPLKSRLTSKYIKESKEKLYWFKRRAVVSSPFHNYTSQNLCVRFTSSDINYS